MDKIKNFKFIPILLMFWNVSCAQTNLELAQGFWEEEVEGFQSYVFVEDNYWYSITLLDGSIDVTRDWFGFYDAFEADSIHPKDLLSAGRYIVFLTHRQSIEDYNAYLERGYFNFYEYDLDEDYFIYYGNDPITLNKIDSLPADVLKEFEKRKKSLLKFNISGDQK